MEASLALTFSAASMAVWEWNSAFQLDQLVFLSPGVLKSLTRVGDLEQHVFHDVTTVGALELELLALE